MSSVRIVLIYSMLLALSVAELDARLINFEREEWTNIAGGVGYTITKQGPGWNGGISHNFGRKHFFQVALSVTNGDFSQHKYYLNTLSVSTGARHAGKYFLEALFIGPSFNSGKIKNPPIPNIINQWSETSGMGIWTNLQVIFRPPPLPDVAFGLDIYSNWNRAKNNYGIRFALSFSNSTKKEF